MKTFYFVLRCTSDDGNFYVNGDTKAAELTLDLIQLLQQTSVKRYGLTSAMLTFITEVKH